jgi:integrase
MVERRIRFGSNFRQTPKRVLRLDRQSRDKKLFEAEEVRNLLDAASPALRSMILLGVNAGFGNTDLARLPQSAIDLETGWADYPRPKTAVERRVPLWPETVKALRDAIDERPKAKHVADDGLCFLTRTGMPWVRHTDSGAWLDSIGGEFKKLMRSLDINGRRGFYALRHTFETIAGETTDQVGVNSVMGHADQTMGAVYREHISDERLLAVVETVRTWLSSG